MLQLSLFGRKLRPSDIGRKGLSPVSRKPVLGWGSGLGGAAEAGWPGDGKPEAMDSPADRASVDTGQHHGVSKCNITCSKMTSRIPVDLLLRYQHNQESCGKRAIM